MTAYLRLWELKLGLALPGEVPDSFRERKRGDLLPGKSAAWEKLSPARLGALEWLRPPAEDNFSLGVQGLFADLAQFGAVSRIESVHATGCDCRSPCFRKHLDCT